MNTPKRKRNAVDTAIKIIEWVRNNPKPNEVLEDYKASLIRKIEGMKKSVGDLFPNYKHEPTTEFAMQVQGKEFYNKALQDILDEIKKG